MQQKDETMRRYLQQREFEREMREAKQRRDEKMMKLVQEIKQSTKYNLMSEDYDSYEQSDFELEEEDLYPVVKKPTGSEGRGSDCESE